MKLTSSQDREAVGRWIEGQADRAEGRRILAALPRLARRELGVGALRRRAGAGGLSQDHNLRQLSHPGTAQTPRNKGGLAVVDLAAIRAALGGA